MKNIIRLFSIFIILSVILSCDKINKPYTKPVPPVPGNQKVLVEEFTGHRCTNCPYAHEQLHQLIETYGDSLIIPIAMHYGFFAQPLGSTYPPDYTSDAGDMLGDFYDAENEGLPTGIVNRVKEGSSPLISHDSWASYVDSILRTSSKINMEISNSFNVTSRELNATIKSTFLTDFSTNLKLVVVITEDSLISPQADGANIIANYVHMHVLRVSITDTWGEVIVSGSIVAEEEIEKSYTYTLDAAWIEKNCMIVAYIYDETTGEVIQAEKHKVTE